MTIVLATLWPTAWALVLGPVVGAAARLRLSHSTFREIRNRFWWDRDAGRHFVRFGRWIFISTAPTFIVTQGDKLILGKIFVGEHKGSLGLYAIAFFLATARVRGYWSGPELVTLAQRIDVERAESLSARFETDSSSASRFEVDGLLHLIPTYI